MSCDMGNGRDSLDVSMEEGFVCRIKKLDNGNEFLLDEVGQDGMPSKLHRVGSNRLITIEEFERTLGLSPLVQQIIRKNTSWLRRLGSLFCIVDSQVERGAFYDSSNSYPDPIDRRREVRERARGKQSKEFSGLYTGQDFLAHEGSILTMKISPDGQYLASAGEDGVVRVWMVIESDTFGNFHMNSSSVYFTINQLGELEPFFKDREKMVYSKRLLKTSDSACVIFPQKVFQISEIPLHNFHGHSGEVLDLSWSNNKFILSSSTDKAVRLWQVGCDQCIEVFLNNNYITCIQFNPMDDDYFISGSIDGKLRIWAIPGCRVFDRIDVTEIVTALCYSPDGKRAVVGSMTGTCRFYDVSDNRLQLNSQICLQGQKKFLSSRITGLQFSPNIPHKLMVTSADSLVRVLHGTEVICKFRGLRNAGSQICASFTMDGTHMIAASEDSNVYVWNCINQEKSSPLNNIWSSERFFSDNVSVAIPCGGFKLGNSVLSHKWGTFSKLARGEAPHIKVPITSSPLSKSHSKFLKTSCQSTLSCPYVWGLVIVTSGWDGRGHLSNVVTYQKRPVWAFEDPSGERDGTG
ncbi:WD40 repeat [Dillenia turbinata]|uniref:WD40 repeat n=1 Tax=Dillenia turbinata TaxID=194707 RepID=A0AAN8UYE5_9MAGN